MSGELVLRAMAVAPVAKNGQSIIDVYPGAQSVSRALALLKSFSDARPEWTLPDLAQHVGLNKTTTYRLLAALEAEGLLMRAAQGTSYRLGSELIVLGSIAMHSNDLRSVSRPILQLLAQESGEASTLEILSGGDVVVLDEVSSRHLLGMSQDVGARLPAHATSTGKVLLAHADEAVVTACFASPLPRLASDTITALETMQALFPRIRAQGYATTHNELEAGFSAIAAPIHDHRGAVIAAISIGGPDSRLRGAALHRAIDLTIAAGKDISRRLGG